MQNPKTIDLRGYDEIPLQLLMEPQRWRLRAIESIELSQAGWSARKRSVHAEPLRSLLNDIPHLRRKMRKYTHIRLILPVGSIASHPLVDFDVTVNGDKKAHVINIDRNAELQRLYLEDLAKAAGFPLEAGRIRQLLHAICAVDHGLWDNCLAVYGWIAKGISASHWLALHGFVHDTLIRNSEPREDGARGHLSWGWWKKPFKAVWQIRKVVRKHAKHNGPSAAENPLIALPYYGLGSRDVDARLEEINAALKELCEFLVRVSEVDSIEARRFLSVYGEYGRYRDVFVECVIPLDEPFMIKISEKRTLKLRALREKIQLKQPLLLAALQKSAVYDDAKVNIFSARITDPNIEFAFPRALDERGKKLPQPPESTTRTPELVSFYSSGSNRAHRVVFTFSLRQSLPRIATNIIVLSILALATGILLELRWHPIENYIFLAGEFSLWHLTNRVDVPVVEVTILLVPSSFAAALLLTRSNTTLGMRINHIWHYANIGLLLLLWITVAILCLTERIIWVPPLR